MKILLANKYYFIKGGSETSFFETGRLLKLKGHSTIFFSMKDARNLPSENDRYFVSNIDYENQSLMRNIHNGLGILYSLEAKRQMDSLLRAEDPDVAHLHNIYHQISPSILHVLKTHNVPVVMTLHDYKIVCPSSLMLNKSQLCDACRNSKYYRCFLKGCAKNSRSKSFINTVEMYLHHNLLDIYRLVDVFIAPSMALKSIVEKMGLRGKVVHLPYFVDLSQFNVADGAAGNNLVYFGRLSKEKGLSTLIEAVKGLGVTLKIAGEGPLRATLEVKVKAQAINNVEFLGYKGGEELKDLVRRSIAVVVPSEWYENLPFAVIESLALGKPVIGARIGGIPELVRDNETGLTFEPGNVEDLRNKIKIMIGDAEKPMSMGHNARLFVERELNAEKHYQELMKIYGEALSKK